MANGTDTLRESCSYYERYANTPSEISRKLYYYPQWAGHFICNRDFFIQRSNFNSILLLQTLKGSGKLYYRDREYILEKNRIALINCNDVHTYFPGDGEAWSFRFIHFTGNQSRALYEHMLSLNEGCCIFPFNKKIDDSVSECIHACGKRGNSFEVLVSGVISGILHEMLLVIQGREQDRLASVYDYLAENVNKRLTTEQIAKTFGYSRSYFLTMFKKLTGTTLHDYLLCCRLDKAKLLLQEERYTIQQVAELTGFHDTGTFIRAFKKKENVTPLQYRRQNCNRVISLPA